MTNFIFTIIYPKRKDSAAPHSPGSTSYYSTATSDDSPEPASPGPEDTQGTSAGLKRASSKEEKISNEKIKISVAGEVFVTYLSTLERFPDTLLGDKEVCNI